MGVVDTKGFLSQNLPPNMREFCLYKDEKHLEEFFKRSKENLEKERFVRNISKRGERS